MTVAEIKAKLPEADVYEFRPNSRYMIVVDRNEISMQHAEEIVGGQELSVISAVIVFVDNPDTAIRILEMSPGRI